MSDVFSKLFETGILSEDVRSELQEAWDHKVKENKDAVTAELREEFARRYEHDKQNMIEAIDSMVSNRLESEIQEFAEDKQALAEACRLESIKPNSIPLLHLDLGFLEGTTVEKNDPTGFVSDYNTPLEDVVDLIIFWAGKPDVIRQVEFTWKLTPHVKSELERINPDLDPSRIQF